MHINEIFYSLQGEGYFTGTPAVFVRFSGCNLSCVFCDTAHKHYKEMSEEEIVAEVLKYPATHVVVTGGEPTLQLTSSLVRKLHDHGRYVQIETNGTQALPEGCDVDWITCSPKYRPVLIGHIDELKVVFQAPEQDMSQYDKFEAKIYTLQPCNVKDEQVNASTLKRAVEFCLEHPKWRLSLQTHKFIGIN